MLLVFSKASNGQDKEDPSSQFNESNELFNYITQICKKKKKKKKKKKELVFKTKDTYQEKPTYPLTQMTNTTKPITQN